MLLNVYRRNQLTTENVSVCFGNPWLTFCWPHCSDWFPKARSDQRGRGLCCAVAIFKLHWSVGVAEPLADHAHFRGGFVSLGHAWKGKKETFFFFKKERK